jgi:predicted GNAT family N-acyltransferase
MKVAIESWKGMTDPRHEIARSIRHRVFIVEQQVDESLEYENEEESMHYLLFIDETPIATARWRFTEKGIKLERFALIEEWRNRGFGSILLDKVLEDVTPLGKVIYLHSQLRAASYYERRNFTAVGKNFYEADIEHVRMYYKGISG